MHAKILCLSIIIVCGCTHQPDAQDPSKNGTSASAIQTEVVDFEDYNKNRTAKDDIVCKRQKILGSHRIEKVCRSAEQIRAGREHAQQTLDESLGEFERSSVETESGVPR